MIISNGSGSVLKCRAVCYVRLHSGRIKHLLLQRVYWLGFPPAQSNRLKRIFLYREEDNRKMFYNTTRRGQKCHCSYEIGGKK